MLNTEYLSTQDGRLIPIEHFDGCMFILYFTRYNSKKCREFLEILKSIELEKTFSNIVFVQVSMDNTIQEWDDCFKNENWLQYPFFPVKNRKNLFKKYKVDRLPFMVAHVDKDRSLIFPPNIFQDLKNNHTLSIVQELSYYLNLFSIDDFVII